MDSLLIVAGYVLEPFSSAFYGAALLVLLVSVSKSGRQGFRRFLPVLVFSAIFWTAYRLAVLHPDALGWLSRLNSPVLLAGVFVVVPAVLLPRSRWYKLFLALPGALVILAVAGVFKQYSELPPGAGFSWFLVKPAYLIGAVVGFLVIGQYFLSLANFRRLTKITMLVVLVYGGFVFRQNIVDYREMLMRRKDANPDVMMIAETVPVLRGDDQVTHIPGAPCRFSADGGYVQGCPMELLQRVAQVDYSKAAGQDPGESSLLAIAVGAVLFLTVLCFIGARWWCGWVCPLSTLGDAIDRVRRLLGLPHLRPSHPVKMTYLVSGLSLGGFGLLLAKLYPHIDEQGRFMGCKIPVYPFCKLCPGQQVCPVASQGPGAYPPLPTWDWLFGFFLVGSLALLGLFLASFAVGRRLWCHFCPMGIIGGIFNRGGLFSLKKDVRKCNGCGTCNDVCPMDVHTVAQEMKREDVSSFECILCMKCVDSCPQDECLRVEFAGHEVAKSSFPK